MSQSIQEIPAEVRSWIGQRRYEQEGEFDVERGYVLTSCASVENGNPLFWDPKAADDITGGWISPPSMLSAWFRPHHWAPARSGMEPRARRRCAFWTRSREQRFHLSFHGRHTCPVCSIKPNWVTLSERSLMNWSAMHRRRRKADMTPPSSGWRGSLVSIPDQQATMRVRGRRTARAVRTGS